MWKSKLLMTMRLTLFVIIVTIAQVFATDTYSQETRLSLNQKDASIRSILEQIENQSDFYFIYNAKAIDVNKKVSIDAENKPISEILDRLFEGTNVVYKIDKRQVLLSTNSELTDTQQQISISGQVTDSSGAPLPGVTVVIKGKTKGTITDADGKYIIEEVPGNAVLVFSFVGMKTQEIPVSGKTNINVVLAEETIGIDEVVAVGYGTQKKANLTGAVATINSKDLQYRPVVSVAGALQGADPSVNLTFNTGVLDSGYKINIRGVTSVNGGTPLILADGMEVNLNQINPNDIESISVLKDASSAAIYGAKASSGVILITTKTGRNTGGTAKISYNGRMGWSQNTTSTDFIYTGYDHVNIVNKFYEAYRGTPMLDYSSDEMQMLQDRINDKTENPDRPWTITGDDNKYYYYGNFDWYHYFYRDTRPQTEHNISATGGNDKVNYYVSGRYLSEDGIFKIYNDKYKDYSFRTKLDAQLKPWLKYTANINYDNSIYKYAGYYDEQFTISALQSNIISSFVPRNPDGSIVQYTNQLNANSPIGAGHGGFLTADQARNSRGNKYLILSNQFDIDLTKGLVLTTLYAYKYRNRLYKYRDMPFEYSREVGKLISFQSGTIYDYYQENHFNINDHNVNIYATYKHTWAKSHNFKIVVGSQYEDYGSTSVTVKKTDLLSDKLSSFSVATGESTISQGISAFRTLGFFGRANYDYDGKYLLEASGRWDGTSRFSPNDRWGFFPSASAGWRMSQENFWDPIRNVINNSKLRFSIGSLGNQQVDYYSYFDQISTDNQMSYTFDNSTKAYYASVSNPISSSLTWETVTTYDGGIDLSLLNSKLNLTGDYYIRDTKNMLTPSLTLPSVFGASTPTANNANLRTKGWELYLSWNNKFNLANKPFNYNIGVSIGDYKTTITKFNNPDKLISDYYEGMTLGEIWGYKVAGLFATDEDAAAYQAEINDKAVNNRVYASKQDNYLRAGDVEFIDLNGDKVINEGSGTVNDPGDKRIIGNSLPRYSYSFRLGANWNGFDISAFFQGVGKQDWFPTTYAYYFWGPYSFPSLSFIQNDFLGNCWSEENTNAYFPRQRGYQTYSSGALGVTSDRYLQNVAYLRLKNLTLGYSLPINKKIFDHIRLYATGENLFYWSKLKKHTKTVDPELTNTSSTYRSDSGVGYTYSKSFSIGVDIVF